MPAWLAGWAARWRTLRGGAWLPRAAAIGQWALVATVTLAMAVQTAGYLGRFDGSGRPRRPGSVCNGRVPDWLRHRCGRLSPGGARHMGAAFRSPPSNGRGSRPRPEESPRRVAASLVAGSRHLRAARCRPARERGTGPRGRAALRAGRGAPRGPRLLGARRLDPVRLLDRRLCFRAGSPDSSCTSSPTASSFCPAGLRNRRRPAARSRSLLLAAYLESFTGTTMLLGFVVLGSMMLAARPSFSLGSLVVAPLPVATIPGRPLRFRRRTLRNRPSRSPYPATRVVA